MATIDNPEELLTNMRDGTLGALKTVPPRYSFKHFTAKASTVLVSANDCLVHSVTVGGSGSASTFGIYNSATAAGTATTGVLVLSPLKTTVANVLDTYLSTGLVLKSTGASAMDVCVTYVDV